MANIKDDNSGGLVAGTTNDDDTVFGNGGDDIINGLGGNDTISGGSGRDQMFGGSGNDTFVFERLFFGLLVKPEIIDGGSDFGSVDRILANGLLVFTGQDIRSIEEIEFNNQTALSIHSAEFAASQFSSSRIALNAKFDAVIGDSSEVRISMGSVTSFDASHFVFEDWSTGTDTFRILGDSSSETITLASVGTTVSSGGGADTIRNIKAGDEVFSGSGNDTLHYKVAPGPASGFTIAEGAILDGGTETDTVVLELSGNIDLQNSSFVSIEALQFDPASATKAVLRLQSTQLGAGLISPTLAVTGRTGVADGISIQTTASNNQVDPSGWTFNNWSSGTDTIAIRGTGGNDVLIGSSQNDFIAGADFVTTLDIGLDTLRGLGGDDTFSVRAGVDLVAGTILDGGTGFDTITFNSPGGTDLSAINLSSIERFLCNPSTSIWRIDAAQIGEGVATNLEIAAGSFNVGGNTPQRLIVELLSTTSADLSQFQFTGVWNPSVRGDRDNVTINGSTSDDTIIGSATLDLITGGLGKDTLTGGGFGDRFIYNDILDSLTVTGRDFITDFTRGADKIDVSAIDANAGLEGDQSFVLDTDNVFTIGEYRIRVLTNSQIIDFNTDADPNIDMQIQIRGVTSLVTPADLIL